MTSTLHTYYTYIIPKCIFVFARHTPTTDIGTNVHEYFLRETATERRYFINILFLVHGFEKVS